MISTNDTIILVLMADSARNCLPGLEALLL